MTKTKMTSEQTYRNYTIKLAEVLKLPSTQRIEDITTNNSEGTVEVMTLEDKRV